MWKTLITALALSTALCGTSAAQSNRNSAIFLHPDGMGANTWAATRLLNVGPDGRLAWDQLPATAAYVGPMANSVTASSNGGGTSHAWGVRAESGSFGMVGGQTISASASGKPYPLMIEAKRAGKAIGIVNTASVTDAGTGTQLAVTANRREHADIARQMLEAEPDLMLGGGEQFFLPRGVRGAHGEGVRTDGRNLIEEARAKGYRIVRNRAELAEAAKTPGKILGLFAAENTFNDGGEEDMRAKGLPLYQTQAPRYDEMVAVAIQILSHSPRGFYLMAEEEATDNLGGDNNASGVLEAASGADRAIAVALNAAKANPRLTVVVASDSDCGGLQATGDDVVAGQPVPARLENGSPVDGVTGAASLPFMSAPNAQGKRLPFAIAWAADGDMSGGGMVRGIGPGAALVRATMDSTDVFKALHAGLFGPPRRR